MVQSASQHRTSDLLMMPADATQLTLLLQRLLLAHPLLLRRLLLLLLVVLGVAPGPAPAAAPATELLLLVHH
jgi:hypothetical protein